MKKLLLFTALLVSLHNLALSQYTCEPTKISAGAEYNLILQEAIRSGKAEMFKTNKPGVTSEPEQMSTITTFDALNFDGNAPLNGGYLFIPPDNSGAAGPSHVVNVINCAVQFWTKAGSQTYSQSLQTFFSSLSPTNSMFDPKVIYDQYNSRFLIVALEQNTVPSNISYIHLAVSDDSDPNGTWYYTKINSKFNISGADYWTDYPGFGVCPNAVYVTGNLFRFSGSGAAASRLWIINKTPFYTGGTATVNVYDPCTVTGVSSTTMIPAHMYGTPQTGVGTFLVRYSGYSDGTNEYLSIIRVDNPTGTPSFNHQWISLGDIDKASFLLDEATQPGTATTIITNDRRALDVVWRGNYLYVVAEVKPQNAADSNQTTAHWWKVNTTTLSSLSLYDQGNIGGEDISTACHTYFPSIAVDASGTIAIGFSASSPTIYAGAYYTFRYSTDPLGQMRTPTVFKAGVDYYIRKFGGTRNRWGDYSGISVDPSEDGNFWVYNQYAMTRGTLINGEDGRWATAWAKFTTIPPYPVINGIIGTNEYGVHTNGQNQETSGSTIWYLTWDNTNLYIGISTATYTEGAVIYIDKNPIAPINGGNNSNGTLPGQPYDNTNFAELQFRADFVCYFKSGYREYRTANGSNGWSSATTSFGSYADNGSNVREISIPWSAMGGKPSSFNWFGYVTSPGGYVYGQVPTENTGGAIGTSARYVRYYTVSITDSATATKPFSRNSYVFNSTTDVLNFGAINVYDFTMNNSSRTILRIGGAWGINGNFRIDAGTISFGNIFDATIVAGDVYIGSSGSLQLSGTIGGDIYLSGSWTQDGQFFANQRMVQFAGTNITTLGGTANPVTMAYLNLNKTGGSHLVLGTNVDVKNAVTFFNGTIRLQNYNITFDTLAGVSGTPSVSNMFVINGTGEVRKKFSQPDSFLFPIGEILGVTEYTPVSIKFTGGTFSSAYVGVKVTNTKHLKNYSSTHYLNRYWTINQSGISAFACNIYCTYTAADVVGGEPFIFCGKYTPTYWTLYNPADLALKRLTAYSVNSLSDFTGGELKYVGGTGFLDVTAAIEGLYNSGTNTHVMKDTITAELRNITSPYAKVDEAKVVLDSVTLTGRLEFNTASSGTYYFVLKHRNGLETWSKSGGETYTRGSYMTYNFTLSAAQAYGSNLVQKGSRWCIYSGDVNHDGQIDLGDLLQIDTDNQNFVTGYTATDVNGDGQIDLSDLLLTDTNNQNFIGVQKP